MSPKKKASECWLLEFYFGDGERSKRMEIDHFRNAEKIDKIPIRP